MELTPTEEPTSTHHPHPDQHPDPHHHPDARRRVAKVTVKGKVRAGKAFKITDVTWRSTRSVHHAERQEARDGQGQRRTFAVTKIAPKNLSGKSVLRVLDREGDVVAKTTIKVLKRKAA